MGAVQTTYAERPDTYRVGHLANGEDFNSFSRTVETAAGLAFGVPAAQGAADRGCIAFVNGGRFLGITRANPAAAPADADKYAQYKEAGIVDFGVIPVNISTVVAARDAVYWDSAVQKFTNDNTKVACPNCVFDTAGAANGIALVRIRKA